VAAREDRVASGDSGLAEVVVQDLAAGEAVAAAARGAAELEEVAMAPRAPAAVRAAQEPRICGRRAQEVVLQAGLVRDWAVG